MISRLLICTLPLSKALLKKKATFALISSQMTQNLLISKIQIEIGKLISRNQVLNSVVDTNTSRTTQNHFNRYFIFSALDGVVPFLARNQRHLADKTTNLVYD